MMGGAIEGWVPQCFRGDPDSIWEKPRLVIAHGGQRGGGRRSRHGAAKVPVPGRSFWLAAGRFCRCRGPDLGLLLPLTRSAAMSAEEAIQLVHSRLCFSYHAPAPLHPLTALAQCVRAARQTLAFFAVAIPSRCQARVGRRRYVPAVDGPLAAIIPGQ